VELQDIFLGGSLMRDDGSPWCNVTTAPGLVFLEGINAPTVSVKAAGDSMMALVTHPSGKFVGLQVADSGEVVVSVIGQGNDIEQIYPIQVGANHG